MTSRLSCSLCSARPALPDGKAEYLRTEIISMQRAFSAVGQCRKPVIAAIHGSCIGAGVDLITACDMRYASADARFCVKGRPRHRSRYQHPSTLASSSVRGSPVSGP